MPLAGGIPGINYIAWLLGIVGIVLSVQGKKKAQAIHEPTGTATAGLVLSIIGLALSITGLICTVLCVGALGAAGAGLGGLGF